MKERIFRIARIAVFTSTVGGLGYFTYEQGNRFLDAMNHYQYYQPNMSTAPYISSADEEEIYGPRVWIRRIDWNRKIAK